MYKWIQSILLYAVFFVSLFVTLLSVHYRLSLLYLLFLIICEREELSLNCLLSYCMASVWHSGISSLICRLLWLVFLLLQTVLSWKLYFWHHSSRSISLTVYYLLVMTCFISLYYIEKIVTAPSEFWKLRNQYMILRKSCIYFYMTVYIYITWIIIIYIVCEITTKII